MPSATMFISSRSKKVRSITVSDLRGLVIFLLAGWITSIINSVAFHFDFECAPFIHRISLSILCHQKHKKTALCYFLCHLLLMQLSFIGLDPFGIVFDLITAIDKECQQIMIVRLGDAALKLGAHHGASF